MKLKYFGTSAAEGFPGLFCECEYCEKARKLGGKNLRSRSQALVDGELLIDFPPDTLYHVYSMGLPLHKIKNVIITHSHSDHLYEKDFSMRRVGYSYFKNQEFSLNIYGSQPTLDKVSTSLQQSGAGGQTRWSLFEFEQYKSFVIGTHLVTPLKANHDFKTLPYIFDIEKDGKRLLYGNDTGIFIDETWDYLEKNRPFYNLVSLDCTGGIAELRSDRHMNLHNACIVKDRLIDIGCADKSTIFVLHHFSHNGCAVYDDLVPVAGQNGFLVSYDGMEIDF